MTARSLRWLAPALLLAVAANQIWLSFRADLTPWCGGGFGMFSTVDGRFARHLHAFALSPSLRVELAIPVELRESALAAVALPSESRLRAFARELEPYAASDFEAPDTIRIEVFTRRVDPGTLAPRGVLLRALEVPLARP